MEIGILGLGKMGLNIALNLKDKGFNIMGQDLSEHARTNAERENLTVFENVDQLMNALTGQRIILLSTPAGEITNDLVAILTTKLHRNDIIVDCGNSYFKDSVLNYEKAKSQGIHFLDCGTSGGMEGARNGACLMIGGEREAFDLCEPVFKAIACEKGYIYSGKPGSGHYLKMVHNGIEYGMMQAIGEGMDILQACEYDYDFEQVADVWNHGSVIRSWLIELLHERLVDDNGLEKIKGVVDVTGEGQWTVEEALRLKVPAPVIANSVFVRYSTKIEDSFAAKVVASIRNGFGGHKVVRMEE